MLASRSIILVLIFTFFSCASYREQQLKKEGDRLVSKIENFKKDKGRFPESLTEIGMKETENGPIYYKKESDTEYVVWFGTQLGESVTYDSETKEWTP